MDGWGLLTTHGLVLTHVGRHPHSTGLEIAQTVGLTERAVRRIIADLQAAGYVALDKVGRRNRYRIDPGLPLLCLGERAVTLGELLALLSTDAATAPDTQASS